jgi:uncharacterized HhH-GPD family protein
MPAPQVLYFTDDDAANRLIAADDLALLIGIVLYQQVPTEKAFSGPLALRERLGGPLDATRIAEMDPDALEAVFRERPALHRFPAAMAKRVQAVCRHLVDHHGGRVAGLWEGAADAHEVMGRLTAMPGFGDYKARIYLGVLAERFGVRPAGWEEHLPDWPSIVDISGAGDLQELKERKKAWKAAGGRE